MQHYRNVDNTMRAYPEIAANWEEAGITPDKWVAFYCGTGWRASETWFYAYLQGWQRIAVYDGGWFEWSQDPINNPIEVGDPGDGDATRRVRGLIRPVGAPAVTRARADHARRSRQVRQDAVMEDDARLSPLDRRARDAGAPLRLGIVGCGDVAYRHYLPALEPDAARVRIVSVMDTRLEAAEALTREIASWSPDARAYDELDAMLEAGGLDGVIDLAPAPSPWRGQRDDPRCRRRRSTPRSRSPARSPMPIA